MRILISPAKQMIPDPDTLAPVSQPRFLPEARLLLETLRQKLTGNCSPSGRPMTPSPLRISSGCAPWISPGT